MNKSHAKAQKLRRNNGLELIDLLNFLFNKIKRPSAVCCILFWSAFHSQSQLELGPRKQFGFCAIAFNFKSVFLSKPVINAPTYFQDIGYQQRSIKYPNICKTQSFETICSPLSSCCLEPFFHGACGPFSYRVISHQPFLVHFVFQITCNLT